MEIMGLRSSLSNLILSELILQGVLGKTSESFGRFRHLHLDKDHLVVETRCGGPNREFYQSMYDEMQAHSLFDYYKDDDFDHTYAYFFFRYPPNIAEQIKCIVQSQSTGGERWKE